VRRNFATTVRLYYLRVSTQFGPLYKLGITRGTVAQRFRQNVRKVEILKIWEFSTRKEASTQERELLNGFSAYRYKGQPILTNGNSELFTHDILGLDLVRRIRRDTKGYEYQMLHIVPIKNNARYCCCIDGLRVNGRRKRIFFATLKEAKAELKRLDIQIKCEGEAGLNVSNLVRVLASEAQYLLEPYGANILDAAKFYAAHLASLHNDILIADLATEYLTAKRNAKVSAVYLISVRHRLGRFVDLFGHRTLRTLNVAEIEEWLHGLGLGAVSINNHRTCVGAFLTYAVRRGYLETNPVKAIDKVRTPDDPPEVFTPVELARILAAAPATLLPVLVLGAFAGLRTSEVLRLDWTEVDLARGFVHVAARKTKSARRRLIKILPNLAAWLEPYAAATGKVYVGSNDRYHAAVAALMATLGLEWRKNALRHSYASYHLAKFEDAAGVALQMGHTSTKLIFENYRELVRPEEAELYWSIIPASTPTNIVRIGAA
jgi:integrase